MESGPAIFAGAVFALFGGALLVWTAVRVRHGRPVAQGVGQTASVTVATVAGVLTALVGIWCFGRL